MKLLILANDDGGLYRFRKEVIEALVKTNRVYICLPKGEYTKEIEKLGCNVIDCKLLQRHGINPFNEVKLIRFYRDILKHIKPGLVFTYTIKPNVYGGVACAKLRIPYVINITGLGSAVENGGLMQKITLSLYKLGLRRAQKVFFQNTENRDFMLQRNIITGEFETIPGSGVNLAEYNVLEYPNENTIDFVFIARIIKEKGIDQYLEAAEIIRKKYPYTRFHICGTMEQDYKEKLNKLQDEEVIIYHGIVHDMTEIYKKASCTIHPTYYAEGMSNVLLESCASGRPIITTDRSGCREIVDDGVNGFVVRQKDSQDLIEKIEKFLSLSWEERRQMGLAGREKVEKHFDRRIVVEKYLAEVDVVKKCGL